MVTQKSRTGGTVRASTNVRTISHHLEMEAHLFSLTQQDKDIFEKKWTEKIVEPDSKEGTIAAAEDRIRVNVKNDMEKIWKDRMEKEDGKRG